MKYRTLGETNLKVSEVSLGMYASGLGGKQEETELILAIRKSIDCGVNLVNTADAFGRGYSEELIGKALTTATASEKVLIATKVGRWGLQEGHPIPMTNKHNIFLSCDASLKRLRVDAIDVYLCHLDDLEQVDVFLEAFSELQEKGKIWYWGVSTNDFEVLKAFNRDDCCSVLEVEYNALNRSAESDIFPYCLKHNVGIMARSPLAMGKLTGKFTQETTFAESDPRSRWLSETPEQFKIDIDKARQLSAFTHGRTPAQAALAFALAHRAVSTVIPGARNADQAESNASASDLPLSMDECREVEAMFIS